MLATACNTVRGAGEDVQSAANAVDDETTDDSAAASSAAISEKGAPSAGALFYAAALAASCARFRSVNQIAISETS